MGELLAEVFHQIRTRQHGVNMENRLELVIKLFLADQLSAALPKEAGDLPMPIGDFYRLTTPIIRRQRHLRHTIRLFGLKAVTAMVYAMLSTRTANCLVTLNFSPPPDEDKEFHEVIPLNQLVLMSPQDIMQHRNCGKTTVAEIETALTHFGLRLGMSRREVDKIFNVREK